MSNVGETRFEQAPGSSERKVRIKHWRFYPAPTRKSANADEAPAVHEVRIEKKDTGGFYPPATIR